MPDKNKAKPKYKSIPKFNHNNASAIYNIARKLGANDTLARAILGVTHVETYPVSKYVKGDVWDYKNHVIERAFSARPYTRGLFHYDMMGSSSDEQKKAAKAKGEYPLRISIVMILLGDIIRSFLKIIILLIVPKLK